MLIRMSAYTNEGTERQINPGDIIAGGENLVGGVLNCTATTFNIPAANIANGIVIATSTSALAASTGTVDSATNIITALAGNTPGISFVPGTTFRLLLVNNLTATLTVAFGSGCYVGSISNSSGILSANALTVTASSSREYLATILNANPPFTINGSYASGSAIVNFVFPPNQTVYSMAPNAQQIDPGMLLTNAPVGFTASNISITGVNQGVGGITGVTLSVTATTTSLAAGVQFVFSPAIRFDSLRTSTN